MPAARSWISKKTSMLRSFPEKHSPLSERHRQGTPQRRQPSLKVAQAALLLADATPLLATARREWSSRTLMIQTMVKSARAHSVASICQHSFGKAAAKRRSDDLGRFSGWGMTTPRRTSPRHTVASDGGG